MDRSLRRRGTSRDMAAAPELTHDVVEEILLRLPPDDPSSAVRASLVCKHWRRLLADPIFRRRYRAFHRRRELAPPMLGIIHVASSLGPCAGRFVPTTAFRPADPADRVGWWPFDCRHGRALFESGTFKLTVWDPMTNDVVRRMREPDTLRFHTFRTAAVACAVTGCDHGGDCHGGDPFVVVFLAADDYETTASACLYSSETGSWTAPSTVHHADVADVAPGSKWSVLAGDAVYFTSHYGLNILRYDLRKMELTVFPSPETYHGFDRNNLLMTTDDGELGLARTISGRSLCLWSWQPEAVAGWVRRRVIDLNPVLPIVDGVHPYLIGFAEGTDIIFVESFDGVHRVELRSLEVTKVLERCNSCIIFPYMSFFVPGRARAERQVATTQ